MLNALETFSVLSESKIEGIETISNRFQHMYSSLKKKPYDPLDHRKPDFEADFFEFTRHISEIQVCNVLAFYCKATEITLLRYQPPFRTVRARIAVALVVFIKTPINHIFFKSLIIPDYGFELTKTIYVNVFRN